MKSSQYFSSKMILGLVVLLHVSERSVAEDWPNWMGPNRDNVWNIAKPPQSLPSGSLKAKWTAPVAGGYSGPAVVGNRIYVTDLVTKADAKVDNFGRKSFDGTERVLCFDANTGKAIWKHEYNVTYAISYPAGPRCTPVVDGGNVYTLGAEGDLFCFEAQTGKVVWSRKLKDDYKTNSALWGYAAHPLIDGDNLITLAGGDGSHTVCLNKKTGKEVWRFGTAPEQGYSPPSIIAAGGVRQLILPNPTAINSVDPATGKLYWTLPYDASNGSIIMVPIQVGKYLFVAGYSDKNLLIELDATSPKAKEVWRNVAKKALSPVNVQPMAIGDVVYGMDQSGEMIAFKVDTGERLWETSKPIGRRPLGSGTAFLVRSGDLFYLFNEMGELVVAKMNPQGYEEISREKIIEQTNNAFGREVVWCPPAFANGCIYVRNDEKLICVPLTN
ncbi:MAG: PQQ-binding-like beta-propeller repeat protein [Planctomycetota bacterium]|nr:PQQ-binding-like beta-propeller repeat protein [Planctomycetota bacterium]